MKIMENESLQRPSIPMYFEFYILSYSLGSEVFFKFCLNDFLALFWIAILNFVFCTTSEAKLNDRTRTNNLISARNRGRFPRVAISAFPPGFRYLFPISAFVICLISVSAHHVWIPISASKNCPFPLSAKLGNPPSICPSFILFRFGSGFKNDDNVCKINANGIFILYYWR